MTNVRKGRLHGSYIAGGVQDYCGQVVAELALQRTRWIIAPINAVYLRPVAATGGQALLAHVHYRDSGPREQCGLCHRQTDWTRSHDEYLLSLVELGA